METAAPVLVTGATGNVGRAVIHALRANGAAVRAAGTSIESVTRAFGGEVTPVRLDFRDPGTFGPAVEGCRAVFLLRPPAISNTKQTLCPLADVAVARGARQIVFLSVTGADTNKLVPHHAVERHLPRATDAWTILRPGFFAQNLGDAYRRDIVEDGRLYVPAGHGRVAFVDVRDLGEVAAQVFARPDEHRGRGYTLTGPEAVTFEQAAALLTQALGRPIRYQPAGVLRYAAHLLRRRGLPLAQVAVQTVLHFGLRLGQAATVDPTLGRLLGRPGHTLAEYIRDHVALWSA